MPAGGARKGSGRRRGPSKETIQRALAVEAVEARRKGDPERELAKDVLEKGMKIAQGAAASFQPKPDPATGAVNPKDPNWAPFGEWVDRMGYFAKELAKYQSPTFRAIMTAPAPEATEKRKEFTLTIFDGGKPRAAEIILPPKKTG